VGHPLGVPEWCVSELRAGSVSGAVAYAPEPLDEPAEGNILIHCSQAVRNAIDL
jgi:hypothetical protein